MPELPTTGADHRRIGCRSRPRRQAQLRRWGLPQARQPEKCAQRPWFRTASVCPVQSDVAPCCRHEIEIVSYVYIRFILFLVQSQGSARQLQGPVAFPSLSLRASVRLPSSRFRSPLGEPGVRFCGCPAGWERQREVRAGPCGQGLVAGGLAVPGQQLVHPGVRQLRDAGEDIGEPGLGVDVVELGGADEGVHRRGALAAAVGAGEQPRFSAQSQGPERALSGIVPISA